MKLHTDIPTHADIDALMKARGACCVSLYLPTAPESLGEAERIDLGNLAREALDRMRDAGTDGTGGTGKDTCAAVEEQLADLARDDLYWRHQARTLAIFATPSSFTTFRLPNRLLRRAEAADRFFVQPLLRAVTFPQTAFVLALSQGSVRVLELLPDEAPRPVEVPDLPTDLESAVDKDVVTDRAAVFRLQGGEGRKVRMRQFARHVDRALRQVLPERGLPLILAATEPLGSIFRSVCRYPDLTPVTIPLSPEPLGDDVLLKDARQALDVYHADQLRELHELFERRVKQGRTVIDLADAARFATIGAIDTVFFDIDGIVPGHIDEETGAVTFGEPEEGGPAYGVVDEIVSRVWLTGGRVLAVRREDVPGGGEVAAILRYTP